MQIIRAINIYGGAYEKQIVNGNGAEWVTIDLAEYRQLRQTMPHDYVDGDYVAFDTTEQVEHREWCAQMDENATRGQGWL